MANIFGTPGNDILVGTLGNELIQGLEGNDRITGGGGIDVINGGAGVDTLTDADFSTATANLSFTDNGRTQTTVTLANGSQVSGIEFFENLATGSGNDRITFKTRRNNIISTGAGNDTIQSGLGNDTVDGGTGNDLLVVNYSSVIVSPDWVSTGGIYSSFIDGSGVIYVPGSPNNDGVAFSNIERFNVTGTRYNDLLVGGDSNDTLNGGSGNDEIVGGGGNDNLVGGAGNDTFTGGAGIDRVNGGTGIDRMLDADFSGATNNLVINHSGATISGNNGASVTAVERFYNVTTGSGNDVITFTVANNEVINTGAGNDTINAGLGEDIVDGGTGDDLLTIDYSTVGSPGFGVVGWEDGFVPGSFSYQVGPFGSHHHVGAQNIERVNVIGTQYSDFFRGGRGNDTLNGGNGDDRVEGWAGSDILLGGAGNDTLDGGFGGFLGIGEIDTLTGGTGADDFIVGTRFDSYYVDGDPITNGVNDYALITDFSLSEGDRIILQGAAEFYSMNFSPVAGVAGTAIYRTAGQVAPELIAIVQGEALAGFGSGFMFGF